MGSHPWVGRVVARWPWSTPDPGPSPPEPPAPSTPTEQEPQLLSDRALGRDKSSRPWRLWP